MRRLTVPIRISLFLTALSLCVLICARLIGIGGGSPPLAGVERTALCQSLAASYRVLAARGDPHGVRYLLEEVLASHPGISSVTVRSADGTPVMQLLRDEVANRGSNHQPVRGDRVSAPVFIGDRNVARIELVFEPQPANGLTWLLETDFLILAAFLAVANVLLFTAYLNQALCRMDPSQIVPKPVQRALDNLVQGLVLLDERERIFMANQSFADYLKVCSTSLLGRQLDQLPWFHVNDGSASVSLPWKRTTKEHKPESGVTLALKAPGGEKKIFVVNSTPITDADSQYRGAVVSFGDVTELESQKAALVQMLESLRASRQEIEKQNKELKYLATRDPLTGCLNRRTFFERFEHEWSVAQRENRQLGCVMVDIDHFKSINDTYGHSAGDEVLRRTAEVLRQETRESDLVCRYGGEEFCLLMPGLDAHQTQTIAEHLRQQIASIQVQSIRITASLGASALEFNPTDPQSLLDQADKSLYIAKRNGRNQVICWDDEPADGDAHRSSAVEDPSDTTAAVDRAISVADVVALLSALASALDDGDLTGVAAIARRIEAVSQKHNLPELASYTSQLTRAAGAWSDTDELTAVRNQLSELCQTIQHVPHDGQADALRRQTPRVNANTPNSAKEIADGSGMTLTASGPA